MSVLPVLVSSSLFATKNQKKGPQESSLKTVLGDDVYDKFKKLCRTKKVDPKLLEALVAVESEGKKEARSSKGAKGLFQVTDITYKEFWVKKDGKRISKIDPKEKNMIVGVDCFAYCHAKVSGWVQSKGLRAINNKKDINTLALAAYNRGVFAIAPILRQIRSKIDKHELNPTSEAIMNEIKRNLPAETRNHSRKIWKEYAKR